MLSGEKGKLLTLPEYSGFTKSLPPLNLRFKKAFAFQDLYNHVIFLKDFIVFVWYLGF